MSHCPHCDADLEAGLEECPACGIILAKARGPQASRRPPRDRPPLPPAYRDTKNRELRASRALLLPGLMLALTVLALATYLVLNPAPPSSREEPPEESSQAAAPPESSHRSPAVEGARSPNGSPSSSPARPPWSSNHEREVQELLNLQAAALLSRDPDLFLATFLEDRQEAALFLYEQLQSLPVVGYRLEASRNSAQQMRLLQWIEFEGMRDQPFLFDRPMQVIWAEDGPRLAQFGKADSFALWDHEPVEVTRTNHFLIFTHPSRQAIRTEVVGVIETAWLALYQRYLPMAERYAAFVPGDPDYFGWLSSDTLIAGVASWRYLEGESSEPKVISPALYLNPVLFQREVDPDLRLQALMHEMVHLALAERTHKLSPNWLVEGSAVYFSGGYTQNGEAASLGDVLERISIDHRRTLGSVPEYAYAGAAVEYLVDTRGVEHFLAFYEAVARYRGDLDRALQDFYGLSAARLDADLKNWLVAMHRFRS